jgi:hypothetical protein
MPMDGKGGPEMAPSAVREPESHGRQSTAVIRQRMLSGAYDSAEVLGSVARRILECRDV